MTENDRDYFILYIYRYRSNLPFASSQNLKIEQIARWSDDYISKYYHYLRQLQNFYATLPKKQNQTEEAEVDDALLSTLMEEKRKEKDDFLGPHEANEVQLVLDEYKNRRL